MDQQELIDKIATEVMKRLTTELSRKGAAASADAGGAVNPAPAELAKYIDHTMLMPDAPDAAFDKLVEEAIEWGFFSVCVNSSRVAYVAKKVQGTDVKVSAVIGFPLGAMDSTAKALEARRAISDGAHGLDRGTNNGAPKSRNIKLGEEEIRAVLPGTRGTTRPRGLIGTYFCRADGKGP
ncbi:MAG: 2-deoxyribose-5-phosphate aldolase, partial [Planctomycetes bacterium]|nr:2-deoxyribose-5-phosphate aldolase [Planctomycetota bacterium]